MSRLEIYKKQAKQLVRWHREGNHSIGGRIRGLARNKALTDGCGADVIFDPIGGELFQASLRSIAWEGRLLVIGFASGQIPQIPANLLLVKNASAVGFYWGSYGQRDPARVRAAFEELLRWHSEGRIRPLVSEVLPLAQALDALERLLSRKSSGKIVLRIDDG